MQFLCFSGHPNGQRVEKDSELKRRTSDWTEEGERFSDEMTHHEILFMCLYDCLPHHHQPLTEWFNGIDCGSTTSANIEGGSGWNVSPKKSVQQFNELVDQIKFPNVPGEFLVPVLLCSNSNSRNRSPVPNTWTTCNLPLLADRL